MLVQLRHYAWLRDAYLLSTHKRSDVAYPMLLPLQLRHYAWLRDAYLLSSRGKFRVTARMVRQPRRKAVHLSCYATLTKDSLSSALVSGTFLWKDPQDPVSGVKAWGEGSGVGEGQVGEE